MIEISSIANNQWHPRQYLFSKPNNLLGRHFYEAKNLESVLNPWLKGFMVMIELALSFAGTQIFFIFFFISLCCYLESIKNNS